ncbi:MAG: signal peptidase II [Candidatus Spyradocola sp.]|jgi:signal peptidase II
MPILYIAVMVLAFLTDRVVKNWAAGPLVDVYGGVKPLFPGVFQFTYAENRGAAFSILQGRTWLLIVLTVAICLAGLYFLFFSRRRLPAFPSIAIALALGGALGNLFDRVVFGYVIDMFDFCLINFAVFNVADSFVNIGVVMLAIWMVFFEEKDKRRGDRRWGKKPLPQGNGEAKAEEGGETHEEFAVDGDKGR